MTVYRSIRQRHDVAVVQSAISRTLNQPRAERDAVLSRKSGQSLRTRALRNRLSQCR